MRDVIILQAGDGWCITCLRHAEGSSWIQSYCRTSQEWRVIIRSHDAAWFQII